jgi:hypothetical protein
VSVLVLFRYYKAQFIAFIERPQQASKQQQQQIIIIS